MNHKVITNLPFLLHGTTTLLFQAYVCARIGMNYCCTNTELLHHETAVNTVTQQLDLQLSAFRQKEGILINS